MNQLLRLITVAIVFGWLLRRERQVLVMDIDSLSDEEFVRIYGIPGEVLLERMGTFDFAPGAVDEMMAAIEATFEHSCESD